MNKGHNGMKWFRKGVNMAVFYDLLPKMKSLNITSTHFDNNLYPFSEHFIDLFHIEISSHDISIWIKE